MEKIQKVFGDNCKDCIHKEVCKYKQDYELLLSDLTADYIEQLENRFTLTLSCILWMSEFEDEPELLDPSFEMDGEDM